MTAPAVVRVRLDTTGAKADLRALYDEAGRGVRVPVTGGGGGGRFGPAGSGGGGAVGAGGFNISSLLGTVMRLAPLALAAAPLAADLGTLGSGLLGGLGGGLSNALGASGAAGAQRGRNAAIEETSRLFGLTRGLGLTGKAESDSFYETIKPFREAAGRGEAEIRSELGFENAKDMLAGIAGAIKDGFAEAVKGLRGPGTV